MNMINRQYELGKYLVLTLIATVWLAGTDAIAQRSKGATPAGSLDAFSIISRRNIFDPGRQAFSGPVRKRKLNPDVIARAEGFSLVGTLIHENGAFAFFDGSDETYRKVLQVTNSIAGFTVKEITPHYVRLEGKGEGITLPVGMQMKKLGPKDWQVVSTATSSNAMLEAMNSIPPLRNGSEPEAGNDYTGGMPFVDSLHMLLQTYEEEMMK